MKRSSIPSVMRHYQEDVKTMLNRAQRQPRLVAREPEIGEGEGAKEETSWHEEGATPKVEKVENRWKRREQLFPSRWTKVPEKKKQTQVWNVRSAEWTGKVVGDHRPTQSCRLCFDPGRGRGRVAVQVVGCKRGRRRQATSKSYSCGARTHQANNGRRTQESARSLWYREDHVQALLGRSDAAHSRAAAQGSEVSDQGAKSLPNDGGETES